MRQQWNIDSGPAQTAVHGSQMLSAPSRSCTVIGIGSHHGDDRAGWEVIDQLMPLIGPPVQFHKAAVPHDLLDWLERETVTHIIDGCRDANYVLRRFALSVGRDGQLRVRMNTATTLGQPFATAPPPAVGSVPTAVDVATELPTLRSGSTHQFDLLSTLQLAAQLARLPSQLVLWTVPVWSTDKNGLLSDGAAAFAQACARQLVRELCDA